MKKTALLAFITLLFLLACQQEEKTYTIYCVGDSTMADKSEDAFPEHGWCMVLQNYYNENIKVHNHARNGRSSKSFIEEGLWQSVLDTLKTGDVVFIQFGHNDQKSQDSTRYTAPYGSYSNNLKKFVNESRSKGARPILFTSIVRRKFGDDGQLIKTHGDYPEAMRKVAQELDVPLVDLQQLTEDWINSLGNESSKSMYVWTEILTEKHKVPRKDNTHLSESGANNVAGMATEIVNKLIPELGQNIKESRQ